MGFGETFKKMIGIDFDDYDDDEYEITQEEINREKSRLDASAVKPPMQTPVMSEPIPAKNYGTGKAYNEVAPLLTKSSEPNPIQHSMNGSSAFKMIVIEPKNFDECSKLVDNLKARKPVIINLENVETDLARKIFDFLSGATCALCGTVQRITQNIFIFAPANVDVAAKLGRNTEATPSNSGSSPWR